MLLTLSEPIAPNSVPAPVSAPPVSTLLQLLFGKHIFYSLFAIARLGVANYVGANPVAVDQLAANVAAHSRSLYRIIRTLAGLDVFRETAEKCFRLTPVGELLKTNAPGFPRHFAIQLGDSWSTVSCEHFPNTLRAFQDSVSQIYGKNAFEFFAQEPAGPLLARVHPTASPDCILEARVR